MNPRRRSPDRRHKASPCRSVQIIFEDKDIIVVDKPEGLLTIATDQEKVRTLYAYLYEHVKRKKPPEKLFIVHRLDREASGLLVFAKSEVSKRHLQDQFKEHSAGRTYMAITEGQMVRNERTIESHLAENRMHRCYSTRDRAKGKRAVTHIKVLQRSKHRTLAEVQLETGRKHQIRVHLAEQGHPIVGDRAYGSRTNPVRRLALHAAKLAFQHPRSGKRMEFTSQPPALFASLI